MSPQEAPTIRKANNRYMWRLGGGMAGYMVLLAISQLVIADMAEGALRYAIAASPVLPTLVVVYAMFRWLADTDEMQRRIMLESLAMGFAGGTVVMLGYGLAQFAGAPDVNWTFAFAAYMACFVIATPINHMRYGSND